VAGGELSREEKIRTYFYRYDRDDVLDKAKAFLPGIENTELLEAAEDAAIEAIEEGGLSDPSRAGERPTWADAEASIVEDPDTHQRMVVGNEPVFFFADDPRYYLVVAEAYWDITRYKIFKAYDRQRFEDMNTKHNVEFPEQLLFYGQPYYVDVPIRVSKVMSLSGINGAEELTDEQVGAINNAIYGLLAAQLRRLRVETFVNTPFGISHYTFYPDRFPERWQDLVPHFARKGVRNIPVTGGGEGGDGGEDGGGKEGGGITRIDLEYEKGLSELRYARERTFNEKFPHYKALAEASWEDIPAEWQILVDAKWVDAHLMNPEDLTDPTTVVGFILQDKQLRERIHSLNVASLEGHEHFIELPRQDATRSCYVYPLTIKEAVDYAANKRFAVRRKLPKTGLEEALKPPQELLYDAIADTLRGLGGTLPQGYNHDINHKSYIRLEGETIIFNGRLYDADYLKACLVGDPRNPKLWKEELLNRYFEVSALMTLPLLPILVSMPGLIPLDVSRRALVTAAVEWGISSAFNVTSFDFEGLVERTRLNGAFDPPYDADVFRPLRFMNRSELAALNETINDLGKRLGAELGLSALVDLLGIVPLAGSLAHVVEDVVKMIRARKGPELSDIKEMGDLVWDVIQAVREGAVTEAEDAVPPLKILYSISSSAFKYLFSWWVVGYFMGLKKELAFQYEFVLSQDKFEESLHERKLPPELMWAAWREVEFAARVWRHYKDLAASRVENLSYGFPDKGFVTPPATIIENLYFGFMRKYLSDPYEAVREVNHMLISRFGVQHFINDSPYVGTEDEQQLVGVGSHSFYSYILDVMIPYLMTPMYTYKKVSRLDYTEQVGKILKEYGVEIEQLPLDEQDVGEKFEETLKVCVRKGG